MSPSPQMEGWRRAAGGAGEDGEIDRTDLGAVAAMLRRRWRVIALLSVSIALLAYAISVAQADRYSATARLLYDAPAGADGGQDPARAVDTLAQVATTDTVLRPVAARFGLSLADLRDAVKVAGNPDTDVVSVTATASQAGASADRANAVANRLASWRNAARYARVRSQIRFLTAELRSARRDQGPAGAATAAAVGPQLADARAQLASPSPELAVVGPADTPTGPSSPKPLRNALVGLVAGLVLGLLVAGLRDRLDHRLRRLEALEETYPWPLLGAVPDSRRLHETLPAAVGPSSAVARAFRQARTSITLADGELAERAPGRNGRAPGRILVLASACPGEGTPQAVAHLASAFAASGRRVLAIRADLGPVPAAADRSLPLHACFGLEGDRGPGLVEVLTGGAEPAEAIRPVQVAQPGEPGGSLSVLSGSGVYPDPAVLLASAAMRDLLAHARSRYDVVLLDAPPILHGPDAPLLAREADRLIVVARLSVLRRDAARRARDVLEGFGIEPLGVVAAASGADRHVAPAASTAPARTTVRRRSARQPQRV